MGLFGIGDGKMELQLAKTQYVSGDKIEGTAILTLNKDVKAKGVLAEIWGERLETSRNVNGQIQRNNVVVYKFATNLDSERAYMKSESPKTYKFELDAPQVGAGASNNKGAAATMFSVLGGGMGNTMGPITWFVEVKLVMPFMELAISRKQQIQIEGNSSGMQGIQ